MRKRKIRKIGNSYYVKLEQTDLKDWKKKAGDEVDILSSEEAKEYNNLNVACGYCQGEIFSHETRIKKQGEAFHNKCMKKMRKIAKKRAFG